jgi:hypothetical protein
MRGALYLLLALSGVFLPGWASHSKAHESAHMSKPCNVPLLWVVSQHHTASAAVLLAPVALIAPIHAVREEPVPEFGAGLANEAASPFISIIKMLMGGSNGDVPNDAKTVAELAQNAPGNMSIMIDGTLHGICRYIM